ncbi:AbiH family protein [Mesoflavibacter zeaxanthinifaciens]|uniref:AbiH family protein n=1 Tax=Mesoflavibacter zeaxanthinifaciens TaxID=393060 RepID=UPI00040FAC9C|nr:AbiH family protein [Mesoflavibacter zeaxanthinifaciens]
MPKILITGNGFDLNYNLPTHYSDFINILNFIERDKNYEFHKIYSKINKYQDIVNDYNSFELDTIRIEKLKKLLNDNLWFNFFSNEYKIDSWIDFENRIEKVLSIIFKTAEIIKDKIFDKKSILIKNNESFPFTYFKNNIEHLELLKNFKIISYRDLRSGYFVLNEEFLVNKYDHHIDLDIEAISNCLKKSLYNFKKIFNYYFEIFVFPFYENKKNVIDKLFFKDFNNYYTFNYTPTFERFVELKNTNVNYLHGNINSENNKIVLGINKIDESFLENKYFIPFTKTYQKLDYDTDFKFLKEFENKKSNYYMIFFWGHSLDKSDKEYIDEVFSFINSVKSQIKKIVVIYHTEKSKSQLLLNLIDIRGEKDIVNLMKEDNLIFVKIDSENLKKLLLINTKKDYMPIRV